MVEVKFDAHNEMLSISGGSNGNCEVAQSTVSFESGKTRKISTKICAVFTKENIGKSIIMTEKRV